MRTQHALWGYQSSRRAIGSRIAWATGLSQWAGNALATAGEAIVRDQRAKQKVQFRTYLIAVVTNLAALTILPRGCFVQRFSRAATTTAIVLTTMSVIAGGCTSVLAEIADRYSQDVGKSRSVFSSAVNICRAEF
jgi:spore maturation protein SpmA